MDSADRQSRVWFYSLRDLAVIYIIDLEDCFSMESWNPRIEVYLVWQLDHWQPNDLGCLFWKAESWASHQACWARTSGMGAQASALFIKSLRDSLVDRRWRTLLRNGAGKLKKLYAVMMKNSRLYEPTKTAFFMSPAHCFWGSYWLLIRESAFACMLHHPPGVPCTPCGPCNTSFFKAQTRNHNLFQKASPAAHRIIPSPMLLHVLLCWLKC